jgi:hypothetical protein
MSQVSYSALRQQDWYASQPRFAHIEDFFSGVQSSCTSFRISLLP